MNRGVFFEIKIKQYIYIKKIKNKKKIPRHLMSFSYTFYFYVKLI